MYKTTLNDHKMFDLTGSVKFTSSDNKKDEEKKRSIEALSELFSDYCRLSILKAVTALQISTGLTHMFLKIDLNLEYSEFHE